MGITCTPYGHDMYTTCSGCGSSIGDGSSSGGLRSSKR